MVGPSTDGFGFETQLPNFPKVLKQSNDLSESPWSWSFTLHFSPHFPVQTIAKAWCEKNMAWPWR